MRSPSASGPGWGRLAAARPASSGTRAATARRSGRWRGRARAARAAARATAASVSIVGPRVAALGDTRRARSRSSARRDRSCRARPRRTASTPARPDAARTHHAPNTVLCGAFWLKSTKMRSPRSSFHHASVTTSGWRRASSRANATAPKRTWYGSQRGASRRYTWMPCLPVVFGKPTMPSSSSSARTRCGDRARVLEVGAGSRVEVDAELVGVLGIVGARGPHVEAEAAEVHGPRDVREVGDHERARRRAVGRAHDRRW